MSDTREQEHGIAAGEVTETSGETVAGNELLPGVYPEPTVLERITLTIELTRDSYTPDQWSSHCIELDIISAGMTPEMALEAVAEAVRMTVGWTLEELPVLGGGSGALSYIAECVRVREDLIATTAPRAQGDER